jgi:hypothetical protein
MAWRRPPRQRSRRKNLFGAGPSSIRSAQPSMPPCNGPKDSRVRFNWLPPTPSSRYGPLRISSQRALGSCGKARHKFARKPSAGLRKDGQNAIPARRSNSQKISDVGLRNDFVQSTVSSFSYSDSVEAAKWLSSHTAKLAVSSSYMVSVVSEYYAKLDPGAAAGWASSITDGALCNRAPSAIARPWIQTSLAEAGDPVQAALYLRHYRARFFCWIDPARIPDYQRIVYESKKLRRFCPYSFFHSPIGLPSRN